MIDKFRQMADNVEGTPESRLPGGGGGGGDGAAAVVAWAGSRR